MSPVSESAIDPPIRSIVIPVLDESPGSPFNIHTLLEDLSRCEGEVIVVFNNLTMASKLALHPRINSYVINNLNAGVARGWNIGMRAARGRVCFVLNADLKVEARALDGMQDYLQSLPDAAMVGIEGEQLDWETLKPRQKVLPDDLTAPVQVDRVNGYCFAVDLTCLRHTGIAFDPRLSPYFFEEIDMGMKLRSVGLAAYAVPVEGIQHHWGISKRDRPIAYFGRAVKRNHVLARNGLLLQRLVSTRLGKRDN